MSIRVECPNPNCDKVFKLKDELAGKKVRCGKCGTPIFVPRGSMEDTGKSGESVLPEHHPARLTCTNCGAVLGVRDAVCPNCGGDVRSGITVMRITEEEKNKHGLFSGRGKGRGLNPLLIALIPLVLLILAGVAYGILSRPKEQTAPPGKVERIEETAAEVTTEGPEEASSP